MARNFEVKAMVYAVKKVLNEMEVFKNLMKMNNN